MPSRKKSSPAQTTPQTSTGSLTILGISIALILAVVYFLNSHLEWFYIFNPSDLHDLSLRAISAHGNDTAAVVAFIAGEMSEKFPGGYVNLDQEWIFNNAGGAMGAMYILHASKSFRTPVDLKFEIHHMTILTISRRHRVPDHLWYIFTPY